MSIRSTRHVAWLILVAAAALAHARVRAQPTPEPPDASAPEPQPSEASPPSDAAVAPTPSPTAPSDDQLQRELAEELARQPAAQASTPEPQAGTPQPAGTSASGNASANGLSTAFNPAVSATALMLGGGTNRRAGTGIDSGELRTGPSLQEAELRFSAIVDPYFRADVMLAGDLDGVAFEEAYLSTLSLPRVTIRAGQLPAALGRHNPLHTHAFPFLTAPLPWRVLLGPDGLRDPGVSVDVLLPLPFFAEVNAQAFRGEWRPFAPQPPSGTGASTVVSDLRRDQDLAYLGHLKLLFDLGEPTTLELGGTYLAGRNAFGALTQLAAADVTLKWRPIEAERYTGIEWTTEYLWDDRKGTAVDRERGGGYTALRYQFAQRFWVQARGALLGWPRGGSGRSSRTEALVAFVPSEFSALRLQYAFEPAQNAAPPVHEVFLQAIVSIGAHPAHAY